MDTATRDVDPDRLLYSLMFPAIIMPMTGWMFAVSLPTIRDDLGITPDVAAWIATAFTLCFMMMMPVYGRISEGLGKRRLLLWGIAIFVVGALLATFSTNLTMVIAGRAVQGLGVAGLLPLSLALITEVFPPEKRGKAMGLFSTAGPITGVIGPVSAGFIVAAWGWRASFVPALIVALIGFVVVSLLIPSSIKKVNFSFLGHFDWLGVGLLAATLTGLLFYFSSRPITGVTPLQDWRLGTLTLIFLFLFLRHERRHPDPFIRLGILRNRSLLVGSACASMRMLGMSGGLGFVMPLYLADIVGLPPEHIGFYLMANPGMMIIFVLLGGRLSDRFGSRVLTMTGFTIFAVMMLTFSQLTPETPSWLLIVFLACFGIGAGLMLAALHRAALNDVPEADLGTASGLYSMIRFLGSAAGSAFGGILLQFYMDRSGTGLLDSYQNVFLWYLGFALLGFLAATQLPKSKFA